MSEIVQLLIEYRSFIIVGILIIGGIYYALVSKSKSKITDKFIERYHEVLEITLAGACIVEALIASRVAAEEGLADARFMLHIILVFISAVVGFRIVKEVTEVIISIFGLIQAVLSMRLGSVLFSIVAFALQAIGAILAVVATVAGPFFNWLLIAVSQGDAKVDLNWSKVSSISDVIQFRYMNIEFFEGVHQWTISSFAVLFLHIVVILILTITSSDKLILDKLKEITVMPEKKKEPKTHTSGGDKLPRDDKRIQGYITKNTNITEENIFDLLSFQETPAKIKGRKARMMALVHEAMEIYSLVKLGKKKESALTSAHANIEYELTKWLQKDQKEREKEERKRKGKRWGSYNNFGEPDPEEE